MKKVTVIGSVFSGLSCAAYLAKNGCDVTVIEKNDNCTWFISKTSKLHARKKWIISSISPKGELTIDEGAKKALINGKSLLAAGIKRVSGKFNKGDHIKILDNKKITVTIIA